jgi:hypothetical protein
MGDRICFTSCFAGRPSEHLSEGPGRNISEKGTGKARDVPGGHVPAMSRGKRATAQIDLLYARRRSSQRESSVNAKHMMK